MIWILALLGLFSVAESATERNCSGMGIYHPHFAKCYFTVANSNTWFEAYGQCEDLFKGGELVSIQSSYEAEYVASLGQSLLQKGDFWIGASDMNQPGTWAWPDDTPMGYQNWAPGFPEVDDGTRCVYVNDTGLWKDASCTGPKKYMICQTPPINPTNLSTWTYSDVTKAYYKPLAAGHTWDDFENLCKAEGGHLASIHSDAENDIIAKIGFLLPNCEQWAIGFRSKDFVPAGWFEWTDGTAVDYEKWAGSNPWDNWPCTFMRYYDGGWWNYKCKTALLNMCAVCKKT